MENPSEPKKVRFGEFELDLRTGELSSNSHRTVLQEKPFRVLLALLERPGEMVTREELIKRLWSAGTFVDFNPGLNKAVSRLREILEDSGEQPRFIETFPKRGYRFVASVTVPNGAEHGESSATAASETIEEVSRGDDRGQVTSLSPEGAKRKIGWKSVLAATAAVAMVVAGGYVVRSRMERSRRPNLEKFRVTRLTDTGKVLQAAMSPDGRYVTYSMGEHGASGLWLHQLATHSDVQILPANAAAFDGLTFSPDGNQIYYVRADSNDPGFRYLYVMPVLGGPSRLLIKDIDSPVSFSPDGQRFIYTRGIPTRNAMDLRIANADGGGDHLLTRIDNIYPGFQPGATWSPDGRTVAVSSFHRDKRSFVLSAVSVSDGNQRELYSSSRWVGRPLWVPEGDALLLVMGDQDGRGQLCTMAYPKGEVRWITNDLTGYAARADLTRDAKAMAATTTSAISNVWAAPATNLSRAQQITSIALPLFDVVEVPDGRLLTVSGGKLWSLRADGSQRALFTDVEVAGPTSCGRYVVFSSNRTTTTAIMRVDANGADGVTLTIGNLGLPACSPDGKYVFYEELGPPHKIFRIPVEGGAPVEIAKVLGEFLSGRLSVSPDGKRLAYPYEEYNPAPILKLAVISADRGSPEAILTAPGAVYAYGSLLWSLDGKSLEYILTENGASNIWEQPLEGGKPRKLTTFSSGRIFDFHWSLDGKRLLLTRGEVSSDAVLISYLR